MGRTRAPIARTGDHPGPGGFREPAAPRFSATAAGARLAPMGAHGCTLPPPTRAPYPPGEAEDALLQGYRPMPGWLKLHRRGGVDRLVCALAVADIRDRHPEAGQREVLLRLASRRTDPEILKALCGWDVHEMGF